MRKAKIVATLGPASFTLERIVQLVQAGMDVARLNFSHGTHADHAQTFAAVREASARLEKPIAILADLCGPKLRIGMIESGVHLQAGADFAIVVGPNAPVVGNAQRVSCSYDALAHDIKVGDRLLLDDGRIELVARDIDADTVQCKVVVGGSLTSKKGLNLPGAKLSTQALTDKDRTDLRFANQLGVDYIALSFVRSAEDVVEAKQLAGDVPVIAKIEKPEAIEHIAAILDAADGIMVARGDLGVEVGQEKVPLLQKWLIRETNRRAKVVITATQMLESMVHGPSPTRAEVSDVANAVLDGTDALMLSGETAAGEFPVESVARMDAIIREIESSEFYASLPAPEEMLHRDYSTAIAHAAARAAQDIDLKAIAVYTETGHSAMVLSEYRPRAAIVALSRHQRVCNRLALHWGVKPISTQWVDNVDALVTQAEEVLCAHHVACSGDDIAVTYGMEGGSLARTNVLKLWTIKVQPSAEA